MSHDFDFFSSDSSPNQLYVTPRFYHNVAPSPSHFTSVFAFLINWISFLLTFYPSHLSLFVFEHWQAIVRHTLCNFTFLGQQFNYVLHFWLFTQLPPLANNFKEALKFQMCIQHLLIVLFTLVRFKFQHLLFLFLFGTDWKFSSNKEHKEMFVLLSPMCLLMAKGGNTIVLID